jgi:Holliday junction resolvasome RuvABC endonuclease subunit
MTEKKKKGVIKGKTEEIVYCKKDVKDPIFVGVDPSYNGFAIVLVDKEGEIIEQKLLTSETKSTVEQRIVELENDFKFIPNIHCLQSVYIEGPSFSSNGKFVLQMGALHYYLRIFFYKKNVNYKIIAPGSLKKFVVGKGVAKKELMLLKTFKKFGVEFEDNNLCDAYGLARLALEDWKNEHKKVPEQDSGRKGNQQK